MARVKKGEKDVRFVEHHVSAAGMVTIGPKDEIWRDESLLDTEVMLKGAFVRLSPPAGATSAQVFRIEQAIRGRCGAAAVKSLPIPTSALPGTTEEEAPTKALPVSLRTAVNEHIEALEDGVRDKKALVTLADECMSKVGL